MSSKWEDNKTRKRNALLDNAFELFVTKGINKTSIADIVEKAGVAKGTFYLYFKDKDDIRNRLILHKFSKLLKKVEMNLAQASVTDSTERILFATDQLLDMLQEDISLLKLAARNLNWGSFKKAVMTESESDDELRLYSLYVSVFENSPHKYKNSEYLVYMIIEFVMSTCYSAILYEQPCCLKTLKPFIYESIVAMMKAQEIDG